MFILSSALSLQCTPVTSAHLKQELPSIPGAPVVRMWHWAFSRRLRLLQFPAWGQLLVLIVLRSGPVCSWPTSLLSISWRQMALHSLPVNWHGQATYSSTVSLPSRASFNTPSSIFFLFLFFWCSFPSALPWTDYFLPSFNKCFLFPTSPSVWNSE